jgi:beta-phosphoglucomutase-like phosphatase (HAD superfamily)
VAIDDVKVGKRTRRGSPRHWRGIDLEQEAPIAPSETVVVDGTTDGAHAARGAGMRCIAIRGRAYNERSGLAARVVNRMTHELALSLVAVAR